MSKQPVPFYDALPNGDADRVRVNAAIMYSMKQDITFCKKFLEAVATEESRLNKEYQNKDIPLVIQWTDNHGQKSRHDAFQHVLDNLRSRVSQNIGHIPPVQPNGFEADIDGKPTSFNLDVQRAIFRSAREIKDPGKFLQHIEQVEIENVGQHSLKGLNYTRPLLELEKLPSNNEAAIAFKQYMRSEMVMVGVEQTGAALGASGVSATTPASSAIAGAKPADRATSQAR